MARVALIEVKAIEFDPSNKKSLRCVVELLDGPTSGKREKVPAGTQTWSPSANRGVMVKSRTGAMQMGHKAAASLLICTKLPLSAVPSRSGAI